GPAVEKQQSIRTSDLAQRAAHRSEEIHAALHFFADQVGDNFGVGLRAELRPSFAQLFLELEIVFDNAVMDYDDVAGAVGVCIRLGRAPMCRPAGVADPERAAGVLT